ncbi:MAG: DUF2158 domain-containing protein [Endozoicomonas sp. (ex Botrylloides leachii)]|nr:DUF2158 domain-containing protein [Endozoicomonas sp. (ex Botrylloides leachii)]
MSSSHIKPGDLVKLKSSGPVMTVGKQISGEFQCYWYDKTTKKIEKSNLAKEALIKCEQESI